MKSASSIDLFVTFFVVTFVNLNQFYKMKQRLMQFLSAENISQSQFADAIGVARAGISHILAGRNNPSYEFITNTMKVFPTLNIEWLLLGKGKMYKTAEDESPLPFSEPLPSPAPAPTLENDSDSIFALEPEPDIEPDSEPIQEPEPEPIPEPVQESIQSPVSSPKPAPTSSATSSPAAGSVKKILVLYDDNSFEEYNAR